MHCDLMDTPEYQELYEAAKAEYPEMLEHMLQMACLSYLMKENIISSNNIENTHEVQEEYIT